MKDARKKKKEGRDERGLARESSREEETRGSSERGEEGQTRCDGG